MNLATLATHHLARIPREPNLHDKRTLAAQARELLEAEAGEPAAVALMLERHRIELPERPFTLTPEQPPPARDPFVEIGDAPAGPHAELNRELILGEVAAATAAAMTDADTRLELARLADAHMQRTAAIDAALEEPWGSHPVDTAAYAQLMRLPLADRLVQLTGEGAGSDEDAGG